jgi:hypothetical protein
VTATINHADQRNMRIILLSGLRAMGGGSEGKMISIFPSLQAKNSRCDYSVGDGFYRCWC